MVMTKTDPAIIKMFYMHGKKQKQDFSAYMKQLKIVPVAISYEFDPGDIDKANELNETEKHGSYEKSEFEDIASITQGIVGQKGRIHVAFGEPLAGDYENAESLADAIDQSIYRQFRLFPSSLLAADASSEQVTEAERQAWQAHMAKVPDQLQDRVRAMYARPVENFQRAGES